VRAGPGEAEVAASQATPGDVQRRNGWALQAKGRWTEASCEHHVEIFMSAMENLRAIMVDGTFS
jgi:hypothetical protein